MSWRVVDISNDGYYLHYDHGHMVITEQDDILGKIHLSDVNSVIFHGYQATVSTNLMVRLAENNIPFVICDKKHMPVSVTLPVEGNYLQGERTRNQSDARLTLKKRLWQNIVKRKILEQASVLSGVDDTGAASLKKLAGKVKSGDPDNIEAHAARIYWQRLLGKDFRRDRTSGGLNAHLNYGYIILRSAMARAVVSTGLNPELGLHHKNALNSFCLIDDLMEPFRPYIDLLILLNKDDWNGDITNSAKTVLAGIITEPVSLNGEQNDLFRVMSMLSLSLAKIFSREEKVLQFPDKFAGEILIDRPLPI